MIFIPNKINYTLIDGLILSKAVRYANIFGFLVSVKLTKSLEKGSLSSKQWLLMLSVVFVNSEV